MNDVSMPRSWRSRWIRATLATGLAITLFDPAFVAAQEVDCPEHEDCRNDYTCTCDMQDNLVQMERGQSSYLRRFIYTYDQNGYRLTETREYGGAIEWTHTYTYEERGLVQTFETDLRGDGTVNSRISYTYDRNGNVTTERRETDADGAGDEHCAYTYHGNGTRLSEACDTDSGGVVDRRVIRTYDDRGNLLTHEFDDGADGAAEEHWSHSYDSDGRRLDLPCYTEDGYTFTHGILYRVYPVIEYSDANFPLEGPSYAQCRVLATPDDENGHPSVTLRGEFHGVNNATPDSIPNAPASTVVVADGTQHRVSGDFSPLNSSQTATSSWDGWVTLRYVCSTIQESSFVDGGILQGNDIHVGTFNGTSTLRNTEVPMFINTIREDSTYYMIYGDHYKRD